MKRVQDIYVCLADNASGLEGLCMVYGEGVSMPLLMTGMDREEEGAMSGWARIEILRRQARDLAKNANRTVRLVRFLVREDVEVFYSDGRCERPSAGGV